MPLSPGSSRETIGKNIKEMEASGHPRKQSIAAALNESREHPTQHMDDPEPMDEEHVKKFEQYIAKRYPHLAKMHEAHAPAPVQHSDADDATAAAGQIATALI